MPAALLVDQSLVDKYLERINRFCNNVNKLDETLKDIASGLKDKFMPEAPVKEEPAYQQSMASVSQEPIKAPVVTADDIDLDALLKDVNLGSGLSM